MVCKNCGSLLRKSESYCIKCGCNQNTGMITENINTNINFKKNKWQMNFSFLIVIGIYLSLILVASIMSVYLTKKTGTNFINLSFLVFEKKLVWIILGAWTLIEAPIANNSRYDGYFTSLLKDSLLYICLLFAFYIFACVFTGTVVNIPFTFASIIKSCICIFIYGTYYFLCQYITSCLVDKMCIKNSLIFYLFYIVLRSIGWIVLIIFMNFYLYTSIDLLSFM